MKIALVILHADPARGGAERYTHDLAAALARRGHEVSLLASSFPGPPPTLPSTGEPAGHEPVGAEPQSPAAEHAPAPPIRRVSLGARGATKLGQYVRFLDSLDAHLDARLAGPETRPSYDVIHAMLPVRRCDVYHPHAGLAAEAVGRGHRKHAGPLARGWARAANRLNLKRGRFAAVERRLLTGPTPPAVLCLSEYVKSAVRRHYPLPDDRLATLFNAVDLAKFDPAARPGAGEALYHADESTGRPALPRQKVIALMVAQDFARKGLREAIAALALVADDRLALVVVGKGDFRPYATQARRRGVGGRVIYAGPTADPYPYYRAADFFLLPTRHDPCSLVVLEALAMGLPVVSTKHNGACEVMSDGAHGSVLQDPGDVPALADALRAMLDPTRRAAMRQACLALRARLSHDRHVDRLLEIYQGLRAPPLSRGENG